MDAGGLSTPGLLEGGTHKVNIRRGETALIHPVTVDVRVVQEGSGTPVSGGTLVYENGAAVDGQRGAAVRGGMTDPETSCSPRPECLTGSGTRTGSPGSTSVSASRGSIFRGPASRSAWAAEHGPGRR